MGSLNLCQCIGNLGKDPDVRYTAGGQAVASFSIGCNESWTDKDSGQKKERVEWINIVVWGKLAEICGEYLKKGKQVYISGRLQTRSWDDKEGNKRYTTEVVADKMIMLGGGKADDKPAAKPEDDDIPF